MSERRVHATYPGMEIVRYDRSGKWYLEPTNPRLPRQHVSLQAAVDSAVWDERGTIHLGLPGGSRFDALVARRNELAAAILWANE